MGSTYELRIVKSQRSTLTGNDLVADLDNVVPFHWDVSLIPREQPRILILDQFFIFTGGGSSLRGSKSGLLAA